MKVSEQWLRELVNPALDIETIAEKLTFAGVELEGIDPVASAFTKVVVGEITAIEQHPDADRLKVCQVDVATDETIQIVTNVTTIAVGHKVPVALVGARLPEADGSIFKIKKSKLRGVLSQGMFCGAETLGINDNRSGLLALPDDATLGMDVREVAQLDDCVLDLDVTPNRADCLSIIGVAREVGVLTETDVTMPTIVTAPVEADDLFSVSITATEACQRYAGRIIKGVDNTVATPEWMLTKLQRAGLRSLSVIVDITNFVLIELGQPMHAFDWDKVGDGITVRFAEEGEKLTLLDDSMIILKANTTVIADDKQVLALAGIMGGLASSVTNTTQDILLESAYFSPEAIAGKARSYGLHTDSSHRFERGVSADLQVQALERATQLILEICGGMAAPTVDQQVANDLQYCATINLRKQRISRVLGITIDDKKVVDILTRLGCEVIDNTEGWSVTPPVFRFDISLEVDLIEELARIYGYDKIPATLRDLKPKIVQAAEQFVPITAFYSLLLSRDYQEIVSYSFVDEKFESLLANGCKPIKLANPLSAELAVMRSSLWAGLLKAVAYNLKRQQSRVRLFETGLTFVNTPEEGLVQRKKIAGAITGTILNSQWAEPERKIDFYDLKGDVEALLNEAIGGNFDFVIGSHPSLHPGQSAEIHKDGKLIGHLGALHPNLEKGLGLGRAVYVFEIDVAEIQQCSLPKCNKVSNYPSVQRDMSLQVNNTVTFAEVRSVIEKNHSDQLLDYYLFDSYSGDGLEADKKSLALSLIFQDVSRTLEEAEVSAWVDSLVQQFEQEIGATFRH
ncbi:MAG: phenylalanine--tRNA ligase subunit beta [Thiotrichaceae bacterium]|nr:phenylalanine--tRNA ligase subunit beta [Thiotrichaceae bacterium]